MTSSTKETLHRRGNAAPKVAYILNAFPMLSETFILGEIRQLIKHGFDLGLFSLFTVSENVRNPEADDLMGQIKYLPAYSKPLTLFSSHLFFLIRRPLSYFSTGFYAIKKRNVHPWWKLIKSMVRILLFGRKHSTKTERQNILIHFLLMAPFAREIYQGKSDLIHAHFADAATSFALLISRITAIPYSFSTHATDIFVRQELIAEKIFGAEFIVTCTEYNKKYLSFEFPELSVEKVNVIYHGLDIDRFTKSSRKFKVGSPVILSVGRLVRKKGIGVLLKACSTLKMKKVDFKCLIVGDGPERARWELDARINHLSEHITFLGSVPPQQVKELYQQAAIFVLPCVIDESGDRDGIPNVIAEAMSMSLPVVSSRISGIPELVIHGRTGFLLEPSDHQGLTKVLMDLLTNQKERIRLGRNGRQRVKEIFDINDNSKKLVDLFQTKIMAIQEANRKRESA